MQFRKMKARLISSENFRDKTSKHLKAHRQISKKWCFEKYCSCDQACQFSPWRRYLENLTIDDKFINKRVRLFIHQAMLREEKFVKERKHREIFLSGYFMKCSFTVISLNMKYFYFSIQHSLRTFLINKKIVFTEKRCKIK